MQTAEANSFVKGVFPLEYIIPNPLNPRRKFDETKLQELADSIREVGILQPLVVTEDQSSEPNAPRFRLIAGERRLKAAKLAGLEKVPANIIRVNPAQERQLMLIENLQREDLDPIDEARAFEVLVKEHYWKQQDLAKELGVSQAHIANRIRLLKLPEQLQENISAGIIPQSIGKELVSFCKVPGVAEGILEEIEGLEDGETVDADIIDYAKREAWDNTKPLHKKEGWPEPVFELKNCEKCKERISLTGPYYGNSGNRYPRCLNVKCWEKKQAAAQAENNEAVRQKLTAEKGKDELINLSDMDHNSYQTFNDHYAKFDQSECEVCVNLRLGVYTWSNGQGEPKKVCIDPACFKKKQAAHEKEARRQEKVLKAAFEEWKDEILEEETTTRAMLVYMAAQALENAPMSFSGTDARDKLLKALYGHYGWDVEQIKTLTYENRARELVAKMETLDDEELAWVIRFALLRAVDRDNRVFAAVFGKVTGTESMPQVDDGPRCRVCGCTENNACEPGGCHWVDDDLCSECVGKDEASV